MEKILRTKNVLVLSLVLGLISSPLQGAWTYRGVCYDADWENKANAWYGTLQSISQLKRLTRLNVNSISVTPFAFQRNVNQPLIQFPKSLDPGLADDIQQAKKLGLKVILKPHIWSNQFWDGSGNWRGTIEMKTEEEWEQWFLSYKKMIVQFAKIATQVDADLFVIGLEYKKATIERNKEWTDIINAVRMHYKGPLTYAANDFEEASQIGFWNQLDTLGINAYFSLTQSLTPTKQALEKSWRNHRENLELWSQRENKNVLITEVGYASINGAARMPYAWPRKTSQTDFQEQVDAYEAMFKVLSDAPWLEGIFIWKYKVGVTPVATSREPSEAHFVFQNKPAEKIIKSYYQILGKETN